jgi:gamma-glutamylcyclotransferase (GGCT)/AIG2-like uncharacterized protein YtfP
MDDSRIRLERKVKYLNRFSGRLDDWNLIFNKKTVRGRDLGVANIIPKINSIVEGIVYEIISEDIKKLDRVEAWPIHYKKKYLDIKNSDKIFNCLIYVANPNKLQDNLKPEKNYLKHLLAGKDFLSENYFLKLSNIPTYD